MVAHVLMEEIGTTFASLGMKNVAKVIENRKTNDPSGQWPDSVLGIVSQSNGIVFVGWKEPSGRGTTNPLIWESACGIAGDLVNGTPITGYESGMGNCRWYHSCRTDKEPSWEPVDKNYAHKSEEMPGVGTVYYYEHAFETDAGWNCIQKTP